MRIMIDTPMPINCVDCDNRAIRPLIGCKLIFQGCANCGRHPNCPIKEAIPKADYEARLKADMADMLTELQLEIEELKSYESSDGQDLVMLADIGTLFQQKIHNLKED